MDNIKLVPHDVMYADKISSLISSKGVKDALGMDDYQTSINGVLDFIRGTQLAEREGQQYSRVIINSVLEIVGVTTLKEIDHDSKICHIGTWIAEPYWGVGYNEKAKEMILYKAFEYLKLDYVFAGARVENIRSQKAQAKLPYITLSVEEQFPEEHKKIERQEKTPCVLNVIKRADFLAWYHLQHSESSVNN
ncbi:GNAT family N-acetyltransferase [Viridibacillus sp. YIM B01967]|uniref:GNAT family N-acetyltransferase n=1 Tax=Viridibacillus soli TaxID=2798301 RepID=A0ABS1H6D2_9BACL|nr:GNAT family N-acetyltransferase [Viridibacillus soli]MBK3494979.1 GNAT family N-acetyltransferase [Viridibacillus soli]